MADWITKSDVKTYCGIALTETTRDAQIDANIPRCQAMIEQYLLKSGTVFGTFSGVVETITPKPRMNKIFTRIHPFITTLTSVKDRGVLLVLDSDFYADLSMGCLTIACGYWDASPNAIEITYDCSNPVPADVQLALIEYVAVICGMKKTTFVTSEGIEKTVNQGIPSFIKDLLSARKIPRCAMG
jgi:hypothetical protein